MNTSASKNKPVRPRLRPSPWDALVVIAVLLLAAALALGLMHRAGGDGDEVLCTISQNGQVLEELSLSSVSDQEKEYGDYVLEFSQNRVRIKSAPCTGQDCVRTGWISRPGQSIVCLPGRFAVSLRSTDGAAQDFDIVVK